MLDTILLSGVLVVLLVILLGRTVVTELVVALYVLSFVGYVVFNALR